MSAYLQALDLHQQILLVCIASCSLLCIFCAAFGALNRCGNSYVAPAPASFYGSRFPQFWVQIIAWLFFAYYLYNAVCLAVSTPQEGGESGIGLREYGFLFFIQFSISFGPVVVIACMPKPVCPKVTWPLAFPCIATGLILLFGFSIIYDASGFAQWLQEVTQCPPYQEVVSDFATGGTGLRILMALAACVLAPIAEECFFRGILYNTLRRWSGPVAAALCSSLFFACIHAAVVQFLPLFLFGIIQCFLYERFRTLWLPILFHFSFNLCSLILVSLFGL